MGLREHEFDIAPELLAALARGTPGPLLDRAMVHGVNVAEAAATLRESEQNERLRENASAVEGQVEAALHGVEAAIGSVRDRGLFDVGHVGGVMPGGADHLGNVGVDPKSLGPGRSAGKIPIGKHGWIRGSTVHDFLLGLKLGGHETVSQQAGTPRTRAQLQADLAAAEKALYELSRRAREAEDRLNNARRNEQNSAPPTSATQSEMLADAYARALDDQFRALQEADRIRAQLRQRRHDNPDALIGGSALDSAVTAFLLLQQLLSLGGLGVRDTSAHGPGAIRVPSIVRAIDPSPTDSTATDWQTSLYGVDLLDLVDPSPEL